MGVFYLVNSGAILVDKKTRHGHLEQCGTKRTKQLDARYMRSEKGIHSALQKTLTNRQINVRTKDLCNHADITRPTFYEHCQDSTDALKKYEAQLQSDFWRRLPDSVQDREVIFTVLLGFIGDEQGYFDATVPNSNFWLLQSILDDLQPKLAKEGTNRKIYDCYTYQQIGIIGCWVKYEKYAKGKIPLYVAKMRAVRLMDIGL